MDRNPSLSLRAEPPASERRGRAPLYHAALHSVQKPPGKPWKKPDQAPPPQPRVYRVDPRGFRQLVQRLTGVARSTPQPLRETAPPPPPLKLAAPALTVQSLFADGENVGTDAVSSVQSPTGFLGLLSPSFYSSLCSFPLLSPAGPIESMGHI
ncbi:uncharacterized protein LOC135612067 [Musa acuminata AAA Group]